MVVRYILYTGFGSDRIVDHEIGHCCRETQGGLSALNEASCNHFSNDVIFIFRYGIYVVYWDHMIRPSNKHGGRLQSFLDHMTKKLSSWASLVLNLLRNETNPQHFRNIKGGLAESSHCIGEYVLSAHMNSLHVFLVLSSYNFQLVLKQDMLYPDWVGLEGLCMTVCKN